MRVFLAIGLMTVGLFSGCGNPLWVFDDFTVTGEFEPGGSCPVRLNGEPVFSQSGTTEHVDSLMTFGFVPEGYTVHLIACRISPGGESLRMLLTTREGAVPQPGRYRVSTDAFARGDTSAVLTSLRLFRFGSAYLEGMSGFVEFTQIAPDSTAGRFKFHAIRRQSM